MALPIRPLPTEMVEVNGEPVTFHALSRSQALKITTQYRGRADDAEVFILACGMGIPEDEARAWLDTTDMTEAGKLVDGIVILTGLAKRPTEAPADGEAPPPDPK